MSERVKSEILANYDTDIIKLKSLCGVDAANLFKRIRIDSPYLVLSKIPLGRKTIYDDVIFSTMIRLTCKVPWETINLAKDFA